MEFIEHLNTKTEYYVDELPAIPSVVSELLSITEDPGVDAFRVQQVLEKDPALCLAVLRVSNSPYFGMRHKISDIRLALVILGIREVRTIALGISMYSSLKTDGLDEALVHHLWSNALCVGGLSRRLAETYLSVESTISFIGGLLTNVGKSFFLMRLPDYYSKVLRKHFADWNALVDNENQVFGCNHLEIAASLLTRWHLPPELPDLVWRHYCNPERPLADAANPDLAGVVRLGRYLTDDTGSPETHAVLGDPEMAAFLEQRLGINADGASLLRLQRISAETRAIPAIKI